MSKEVTAQLTHLQLRAAGTGVVLRLAADELPQILHWGADLGGVSDEQLQDFADNVSPARDNSVDVPVRISVVPENSSAWMGTPGLRGHRSGSAWTPQFRSLTHTVDGNTVRSRGVDAESELELVVDIQLHDSGLLRLRASVRNLGASDYNLEQLVVALPVSGSAVESLDQAGRWSKERTPQRRPITVGTHLRENRRGRTGADAATVLLAGEQDFGFGHGEVWGLHVGFSGNHVSYLEHTSAGKTLLGGGELLLPGEVILKEGQEYCTPWVYGCHGVGLDAAAQQFHNYLRARPQHPTTPRPVTLNTWEAVYFDHDLSRILALADKAAELGVERFVLDDGWFRGRRDDSAGLGDWFVDEDVWPEGLHPLSDHLAKLGIEFGLWFEPEMINPRSDLAREHPEWILQPQGRMPLPARHQQVLNLAIPEAFAYIRDRISELVSRYNIAYIKWDHNRDLVEAGSTVTGAAGVHEQTLATYRLLEELKSRHPGLEIESCSSGGARVDLGILEFTDRVWASDCIDPLERQQILRWTAQLLPPELVGSHIGSPHSHTTGRTHDLSFRAATALFGHYGIEWDITALTAREHQDLGHWIGVYKQHRALLHQGTVVRVDHPTPEISAHGIIAADRSQAMFEFTVLSLPSCWPPVPVRIKGLDPERSYRIRQLGPTPPLGTNNNSPAWMNDGGIRLSGAMLAAAGLAMPPLRPEHSVVVYLESEGEIRSSPAAS
ncbi:alpha-galactosidase [Arthrobacter psychrolactophilus]|uniref:Alpha-galactosidase n=1 Tax=Arthrobacter psychrolactophilus TaxID=92442 RepID=A0A2V5J8K4_9MICC|nr:alpha-galactosidase [Arthrobacter psychrolactophilus]PYI39380.1 alpha-galactosidase [Arthrobacter psychrolactophilus]